MATTCSALEWVAKQRGLGLLASYTIEMGGDIALFEAAMRIPAWEALRPLTQEEVRQRRIAEEKPVRLVGLAIATAGKQVATFNVVSSLRDMREANMSSIASGTVSPAFMGELTRNGGQSLAVATIDSNKVKTVIIIGPVGLSAGSKQFLAKCNIPSPDDGPAPHRVMGPR